MKNIVFPRIHEIFRYLASTQIIKHTISTLSSQYQQLHQQQQKEQQERHHNQSNQDTSQQQQQQQEQQQEQEGQEGQQEEEQQKKRPTKSQMKILIADQISFTACILLHSIPTNINLNSFHENENANYNFHSNASPSGTCTTTSTAMQQPLSQQYHHQDGYLDTDEQQRKEQEMERRRREQQSDKTLLIIKDIIMLLFDLSTVASSCILTSTCTEDAGGPGSGLGPGSAASNGENGDVPIVELLVLTEVLSSLSSGTNSDGSDKGTIAAMLDEIDRECIVEIGSVDELLSLQSGVFHLLFKFLVLKYTRRQTDDSIFEELISLRSVPTTEDDKSGTGDRTGGDNNVDNDGDHDMIGDGDKDEDHRKTYETTIEDPINVAPFLVHNDLRSLLLASIRQVLESEVLSLDENGVNHRQNKAVGPTVSSLSTMLLSLRNKVLASNLLLLLLPDLSSLANEESDMMSIVPPLWFELMSLITNSVHIHFQFMTNTLLPLITIMDYQQSDTIVPSSSSAKPQPSLSTAQKKLLHPICELNKSLSSILSSLVRNIFICPLTAFNPTPYVMWSLRSKVVCRLFDCIYHIDSLMNGVHHTSSSCTSPLSSLASESINDLSLITLRAIQITFFPDVMITDRDHKVQDNFVDNYIDADDKEKKNTGEQNDTREFEMVILTIRDYCTVHNIYPALFNLLLNSSTMTLMISIISCLTKSFCHSYNDTCGGAQCIPTKQIISLCHACEIVLMREKNRESYDSEKVGKKRRRVSKVGDAMCDLEEIDIDLDCIDDSSFVLALTNFLDAAVQDAKRVIQATKNHSVHDCHASHVSTIEATSIVSSIRLFHSYVGLDSYHGQNEQIKPPERINSILSMLYQAGIALSNFIGVSSISERLSADSVRHISALLDLSLGVLAYSPMILDSTKVDIGSETLRIKLVSSLANTAMICWSNPSKLHECKLEQNDHNNDNSVEEFDPTVVQLLHNEHIEQLENLFLKNRRECHGVCKRIQSLFGTSSRTNNRCFCGFLSNACSSRMFRNYCVRQLIEENFSLQQRYVHVHSILDNLSSLKKSC